MRENLLYEIARRNAQAKANFMPAFDMGAGDGPEPATPSYLSPQDKSRRGPIVLPGGGDQPPLTGVEYSTALPDVTPPARPAPSRVTQLLDTPSTPRHIALTKPEPLSDYRGRQINDMVGFQRDQYVRRGGTTDEAGNLKQKRSVKDALLNALIGFGQGARAYPDNPLAGFAGGIISGVGTAVDPVGGRNFRFEALQRPRLEAEAERERKSGAQRIGEQMQLDKARRQAEADAAQTDLIRERIKALSTPKQPARQPSPQLKLGRNRQTDEVQYYNALDPEQAGSFEPYQFPRAERQRVERQRVERQPSTSEQLRRINTEETAREGTPERIAMDSTNARKAEIIQSAPETFRSILQTGKRADGKAATQREITQAQTYLNRELSRIYQDNLRFTRGEREKNKARRVTGKTSSTPSAEPKANLKDLEKLWK